MVKEGSSREYLLDSSPQPQPTKELSVQILPVSVGQALSGVALPLGCLLASVRVDGGHNDDPGLVDQLWKQ